ncbi:GDP-mannose pyrophosphatase NudK [Salmonella enterica subsp. enterica serovar Stanley]|nr:GDP-mannose pyrophosphatase NudK [Salmonella enterica subsp. enterica serovar Stanley]
MSQTITLIKDKILSDNYFTLRNITYDLTRRNGEVIRHRREVYDRGNGATILLYNSTKKTVLLVRQFRVATWVNANQDGMLIETCAGLLDNDEPEVCIRKEAIEETGYDVGEVRKIFELYMSPGGGVEDEEIEVLELPFSRALEMVRSGEIRDGKTVLLLNYLQTSHLMD